MGYTRAQVCCDAITVLLRKLYIKNNKIIKNNLVISKKKVTLLLYQTEQKSRSESTEELFVSQVF